VGNRAVGDRLDGLVSFAQRRLAAALLLLSPYVPLLFMGEEYGERRPFQYFVSHTEPELVHAVREGRRREFAAFGWEAEVPDPQSEKTFEQSTLDRSVCASGAHAQLASLYARLLGIRRTEPALVPGFAAVQVEADADAGWVRVSLTREGARGLMAVFNFADEARTVPLGDGEWEGLAATDDRAFGGAGSHGRMEGGPGGMAARIAPHAAELFAERA
jgi:maltooligosyltrehalose trehalohydrolase